jgi:choline dehydrogenase-like flavoprotein
VLRDAATMGAAVPGIPRNWDLTATLTDGHTVSVPGGRVTGGRSALNAGMFLRGTRRDFDGWAAAGNELWAYDRVLPALCRSEADSDVGAVVDQRLRVRGVDGLRVVDMSVMPVVTSRGPAATAVMLGERAAELMPTR